MIDNKLHIQLDFDETMFDHRAFAKWADAQLTILLGMPAGKYTESFDDHHTYLPNGMRLYNNQEHIEQATGRSWSFVSGLLQRKWRAEGEPDFCYPDVAKVLRDLSATDALLSILTFGNEGYQRFKISFCPILVELSVHVVDEPKREFIRREFHEYERGVLIDDKPDLELPPNWAHIWLNRTEPLRAVRQLEERVWQVSDLNQAVEALRTSHQIDKA